MHTASRIFSIYLSDVAVELRDDQGEYVGEGRLICSQKNYNSLLKFGKRLSFSRQVPLQDYTSFEAEYQ